MTENGHDYLNMSSNRKEMMGHPSYRSRFERIPIGKLAVDPMNPRKNVGDIKPLVEDIREKGFLSALTVRPLPDGNYGVIRGSRRLEAARIVGLQELPCMVVEKLPDDVAIAWAVDDDKTYLPLSEDELYDALTALEKLRGSLREAAEILDIPWETARGLVERKRGIKLLESEGMVVVDKRRKQPIKPEDAKKVLKKTTAKEVFKVMKRMAKIAEKKEKEKEDTGKDDKSFPGGSGGGQGGDKGSTSLSKVFEDPLELAKVLDWRPKLFKAYKQGPYLHEQLKRSEVIAHLPRDVRSCFELVQPKASLTPSVYPVVRLNPPFDNIRVMLCPNCMAPLKGLSHGSLVCCLECGFPNDDVWRPVENGGDNG